MYTIRPSALTDSVFQTEIESIAQVAQVVVKQLGITIGCLEVFHHIVHGPQVEWRGQMYQIHPDASLGNALRALLGVFSPSELYIVADVEGDVPSFDVVLGKTCDAIMEEYIAIQFEAELITT